MNAFDENLLFFARTSQLTNMKDSSVEKVYVLATCLLMFCTSPYPAWSAVRLPDCRPPETRAELWWESLVGPLDTDC